MNSAQRPIVARFAEKRYWDSPVKNRQSCSLTWGDVDPALRPSGLAVVNRIRKTKRSVWRVEMVVCTQIPRGTPAEILAYITALTTAAESVEWPAEEDAHE